MKIVDWETLNAVELPKWLVGLTSKDNVRRFNAHRKLADYLGRHASALGTGDFNYNRVLSTDAPVLIMPIFVEMLKDATVIEPLIVVEFIEEMSGYWKEPQLGQAQRQRAEKILALIQQEFDLWVTMLDHPNPDVRVQIIEIFSNFPEKNKIIAPLLLNHLKKYQANDDIEALTLLGALYSNIQSERHSNSSLRQDFLHILNQWIEQATYPTIVLANTACYLIMLEENAVSKNAVDTLVNILMYADFTDPMADLHLASFWVDALLSLGTDQATQKLLAIFDAQADENAIIEVSAMLLELHFGDGDVHAIYINALDEYGKKAFPNGIHIRVERNSQLSNSPRQNPTDLQRKILKHFVQKEQLWNIKTNLFQIYHLPASRASLEKLIL